MKQLIKVFYDYLIYKKLASRDKNSFLKNKKNKRNEENNRIYIRITRLFYTKKIFILNIIDLFSGNLSKNCLRDKNPFGQIFG